jgi:FMN phosphatase YigB (HAD superfamily)
MLEKIVIFDLDGTLSDDSHREHHIRNHPQNWEEYNKHQLLDPPNIAITKMFEVFLHSKSIKPVIITGRTERYRNKTVEWIKKHINLGDSFPDLFMKHNDDFRTGHFFKRETVEKLMINHDVLFVVDDRDSAVKMWRDEGFTCLQCRYGDF